MALIFSPFLFDQDQIKQVFIRIFPLARGLYEDKVANIWCTLNVVVKLRNLFSIDKLAKLR
jgi:alpha-1,3-glucosyltransferase